jgi:molybdenum cofactor cytidylyltransferase
VIVGVLLAAGAGARFGGRKLLAPLEDGTPVGVRSARTLRGSVERALAVVRPLDEPLESLLRAEGLEILPFPGAHEGMGASLAFGVSKAPSADGWVVALADMPFLRSATVEAVGRALKSGAGIVAPTFRGQRGHPVGFAAALYPELVRLGGDQGARSLLAKHRADVVWIECEDEGSVRDIDTSSDLSILTSRRR